MKMIRCDCGQGLGKVAGKYEIRCHRCKAVVSGIAEDDKTRRIERTGKWPPDIRTR